MSYIDKRKRMKKRLVALVLVLLILTVLFAGCQNTLSEAEEAVVGKYNLSAVSIEGYPGVTIDSYDYFTLEFFADKTCIAKSKAGVTEYEAEATWKVNGKDELVITTKSGLYKVVEKYTLSGDGFSGTNSGYANGEKLTMTMSFTKIGKE